MIGVRVPVERPINKRQLYLSQAQIFRCLYHKRSVYFLYYNVETIQEKWISMDFNWQHKLLAHQQNILSKIALGHELIDILESICKAIEEMLDNESAKCSILKLQGDQLFHCSAPSITPEYCDIINGVHIGPFVGSCGTAAHRRARVIVEDIATSRLWRDYKDIALRFELLSCWSSPIVSTDNEVLGTFAIYHDHPKSPSDRELELIDYFVHFTSIAFEKNKLTSEMHKLITDLSKSNEKFNAITRVIPDPAFIFNENGDYVDIYSASDELLSHPKTELLGRNLKEMLPEHHATPIMEVINRTLTSNKVQIFEYDLNVAKGKVVFEGRTAPILYEANESGTKQHVLWIARDITTRKAAEKEIKKLAYFDPLTNLPNRRLLLERLTMCVNRIKRAKHVGALLFLDIDNFKRINDSLGHTAGDDLLTQVADRLAAVIRASDTLARIGGDEFVILLENMCDGGNKANTEASIVADKLQRMFIDKFQLGNLSFQISTSIGICLIDKNSNSPADVLKYADTAMYRTKIKGGNNVSFYDQELQSLLEKQAELENDIIRALDSNEFCAYFQPQVDIKGKVVGAEALIRWNHPEKGIVTPFEFISLAERFGLIQKLQQCVLKDLCLLINKLKEEQLINNDFAISINISQSQFGSSTLKKELINIINKYQVSAKRVKLEITESMLAHDLTQTVSIMEDLKNEGFNFSIDDFGTGYSCLSYLHAYPVKELKVDKSFIDNITGDSSGLPIVETIINLAKSLHMKVVAEGVETEEQYTILKEHSIDAIQGYYFAKPLSLQEYLQWHKQHLANS